MKVNCICGNLMHDEKPDTCDVYAAYLREKYYDLLESNPETVEEMVDKMPFSTPFWKCKQCGRLHFFKSGKIEVYNLETEIPDTL